MPKQTGIYKKKIKHGFKYYGAKWWKGKTYVTSLYPTSEDAARAREELIRNLQRGMKFDIKHITVTQFIRIYLAKYLATKPNVQLITLKGVESKLRQGIVPIIGDRKLQSLTPEDMQDLQNKLLLRYKASSAQVVMNEFKRVLRRALIWDYIVKDPSLAIDNLSVDYEKPAILEPEQILMILNDEKISLRERTVIGFGAFGGLRISETLAIQKNKIDFNEKTVYIDLQYSEGLLKLPKKKSIRTIPILPDFEPILKQWYLQCGDMKWLFPSRNRGPLSPTHWRRRYFRPLLKKLGLPDIKYHALRHGFNKMLNDWGVPPREVMQIMGHKTKKMTFETYDRESVNRLVEVTRDIKIAWKKLEHSSRF